MAISKLGATPNQGAAAEQPRHQTSDKRSLFRTYLEQRASAHTNVDAGGLSALSMPAAAHHAENAAADSSNNELNTAAAATYTSRNFGRTAPRPTVPPSGNAPSRGTAPGSIKFPGARAPIEPKPVLTPEPKPIDFSDPHGAAIEIREVFKQQGVTLDDKKFQQLEQFMTDFARAKDVASVSSVSTNSLAQGIKRFVWDNAQKMSQEEIKGLAITSTIMSRSSGVVDLTVAGGMTGFMTNLFAGGLMTGETGNFSRLSEIVENSEYMTDPKGFLRYVTSIDGQPDPSGAAVAGWSLGAAIGGVAGTVVSLGVETISSFGSALFNLAQGKLSQAGLELYNAAASAGGAVAAAAGSIIGAGVEGYRIVCNLLGTGWNYVMGRVNSLIDLGSDIWDWMFGD